MIIIAYFDLDIYQFDIMNTFINALMDELIYVRYLDGFHVFSHCLRVLRALYSLPWSLLLWYNDLSKTFKELSLHLVLESSCLFTNDKIIVFFFVDDIIVLCHLSNQSVYELFKSELLKVYNMREMRELKWFLEIYILWDYKQRKI